VNDIDRFTALVSAQPAEFAGPELLPVRLSRATVQLLPGVAGAGISVLTDPSMRVPLGASDGDAAAAERLQFTLGEGPCLHAHATGQSVFADSREFAARWPELYDELVTRTPYRAVISIPLRDQFRGLGALDLHLTDTAGITPQLWIDAYTISDHITAALTRSAAGSESADRDPAWFDSPPALRRQRVWMAIGMLSVHLDVPAEDALAALRGHAYTNQQDLDDLAADLVTRRTPITDLTL
jgi:hypothetical protein